MNQLLSGSQKIIAILTEMKLSLFRYPVVYFGDRSKELRVRRYDGALTDVSVVYQTVSLGTTVNDAGITMSPAVQNQDFTNKAGVLNFPKGRVSLLACRQSVGLILVVALSFSCLVIYLANQNWRKYCRKHF